MNDTATWKPEDVLILVPILDRPHLIAPLVGNVKATTPGGVRLMFLPNIDCDHESGEILERLNANTLARDRKVGWAEKINFAVSTLPHARWFFCCADDVLFHPGWLDEVMDVMTTYPNTRVVGTLDLLTENVMSGEHATHFMVDRAYIDEVGGVVDEGPGSFLCEKYRHNFCNIPEAPIWMGDLSFKQLGDIVIGDEVMGWTQEDRPWGLRTLATSTVLNVAERKAPLVRVDMESGRYMVCTPDHRWLNAYWSRSVNTAGRAKWVTPEVGRMLLHVVDETPAVPEDLERLAGWLGGIYDGEGSWIDIAQCPDANPEVHAAILAALNKLDIPHTVGRTQPKHITLTGKRQAYVDFVNKTQPVKRSGIQRKIIGKTRFGSRDRIVSVTPLPGEHTVVSMTTTTGNYFAWGYASRNCDTEFIGTAKSRGVFQPSRAIVEHLHHLGEKAQYDDVYRIGDQSKNADAQIFERRRHLWGG